MNAWLVTAVSVAATPAGAVPCCSAARIWFATIEAAPIEPRAAWAAAAPLAPLLVNASSTTEPESFDE